MPGGGYTKNLYAFRVNVTMQMKKFWYLAYLLSFPLGMSPHRAMLNGCAMCDEHARESLAPCNEWGNATVKGSAERKKTIAFARSTGHGAA